MSAGSCLLLSVLVCSAAMLASIGCLLAVVCGLSAGGCRPISMPVVAYCWLLAWPALSISAVVDPSVCWRVAIVCSVFVPAGGCRLISMLCCCCSSLIPSVCWRVVCDRLLCTGSCRWLQVPVGVLCSCSAWSCRLLSAADWVAAVVGLFWQVYACYRA